MRKLRNISRGIKGRVVLRENNVKNDNGHSAVFTEQGASAPQVAAARFLDTISRLLGVSGAANDVVSAHAQVRMSEAPRLRDHQRKNAHKNGYDYHPVEDRTTGVQLKSQSFS